ncbi:sodium-dependent transporter [uncultured Pseudoteredinibacter sp.]|uniref:sodium-dependent transporter n=1 Tax=uncultured Pseudoteredinibacter sp. TaxID=1641701 RepID=UPI00262B9245|nr:sodium-dependent transporter [uncultured Pseudoteredinibacter sp.]
MDKVHENTVAHHPTEVPAETETRWLGYWPFVWGATGAAVSLINLWRFPYLVGEHGGGLFLLVYLLCVIVLAVPIMLAEVLIGRLGRGNPVLAVANVSRLSGISSMWRLVGYLVIAASLLILPIYSVMGGWGLEYLNMSLEHRFEGISFATSKAEFDRFLLDQTSMLAWHSALMLAAVLLVAAGIRVLAWVLKILVPGMFIIMLLLVMQLSSLDDFSYALAWMFSFRPEDFSWNSLLLALGHGFLTLGVGLGVMMTYSGYLPKNSQMGRLVLRISALDLLIAVLAGLVALPLLMSIPEQAPAAGPESLFVSLPAVFGSLEGGFSLANWFYIVVVAVALSSMVPLMEPLVAHMVDRGWPRYQGAIFAGTVCWTIGLGVVMSFNQWQQVELLDGMNFSQLLDYVTANALMPIVGMIMAVIVGWLLPIEKAREAFQQDSKWRFQAWLFLLKYGAPLLIYAIFIMPMLQGWLN